MYSFVCVFYLFFACVTIVCEASIFARNQSQATTVQCSHTHTPIQTDYLHTHAHSTNTNRLQFEQLRSTQFHIYRNVRTITKVAARCNL